MDDTEPITARDDRRDEEVKVKAATLVHTFRLGGIRGKVLLDFVIKIENNCGEEERCR